MLKGMQVLLPDLETRATLVIGHDRPLSDDEFFEFCTMNPELRIERSAHGEIIIMPPAGAETGYRNSDLTAQLTTWAKKDGRGRAFDSNTEYILANGAARSPDASWILKSRIDPFTKEQKRKFLPLCPDFVVELTSPTDRLKQVKTKMREWIDNGAQLGWLIDPDRLAIYIYRPVREPQQLSDIESIAGEAPVDGFRLELGDIWAGL
jgi:Uma2 family endonuclease